MDKLAEKRQVDRRQVAPGERIQAQIFSDHLNKLIGKIADISLLGAMILFAENEFENINEFQSNFTDPNKTVEIQMFSGRTRFIIPVEIRWIGEVENVDGLTYGIGVQFRNDSEFTDAFIKLATYGPNVLDE